MSKSLSRYYKSVKHPCRICYQTVKRKNGFQCMGACEAWVHYQCLNYTPGKIYDIKKHLIEITCPCRDCETGKSNELSTDTLYSMQDVAYEGYETSLAQNVRPIPPAPSGSVIECTENDSEHTPMLVQQVREPVLHTNHWAQMTVQPKTYGIDISCSPTSLVNGDPNSGHLMEEAMETISELSQRLQGLMLQIKRNPGFYSTSPLPWLQVQPTQSQERNTAVVEWTCNEPSLNLKTPNNVFVVNKKCCYYYKDLHVHCQS